MNRFKLGDILGDFLGGYIQVGSRDTIINNEVFNNYYSRFYNRDDYLMDYFL